jgi:6-phosphogluconolactonase
MDNKSLEMELLVFDNKIQLETQLAKKIAYELELAIHHKGHANFLVSGGTTPINLFQQLSNMEIEWSNVTIGLIDERFVSNNSEFSNELLVKQNLLINHASNATFVGMVNDASNEEKNLLQVNKDYQVFINSGVDVSILGMGEDGHTASLFPNDENSTKDLINKKELNIISTKAPSEPKRRISCSTALILSSTHLFLMMIGDAKLKILENADQNNLPIAKFIQHENFKIYYSAIK